MKEVLLIVGVLVVGLFLLNNRGLSGRTVYGLDYGDTPQYVTYPIAGKTDAYTSESIAMRADDFLPDYCPGAKTGSLPAVQQRVLVRPIPSRIVGLVCGQNRQHVQQNAQRKFDQINKNVNNVVQN